MIETTVQEANATTWSWMTPNSLVKNKSEITIFFGFWAMKLEWNFKKKFDDLFVSNRNVRTGNEMRWFPSQKKNPLQIIRSSLSLSLTSIFFCLSRTNVFIGIFPKIPTLMLGINDKLGLIDKWTSSECLLIYILIKVNYQRCKWMERMVGRIFCRTGLIVIYFFIKWNYLRSNYLKRTFRIGCQAKCVFVLSTPYSTFLICNA